jgi:hypothetical protein
MKFGTVALTLAALLLGGLSGAYAAKPKPKTNAHVVLGTTQLEGEAGVMGKTYTLGQANPWNITLNRAEYTTARLSIGDRYWLPKADQKLLVLHYTVHNPEKAEKLMRFDTLQITAVDAKDTNWESIREIGAEGSGERVQARLKPAQKMNVFTAILVPAAGPMPKIIFKSGDQKVVRYYPNQIVKGKNVCPVAPLGAPFADPSDATGLTALARVPAALGTYYPMGDTDVKVDGFAFTDQPVNGKKPGKGEHFLIVTLAAKNAIPRTPMLRFDTYQAKTVDTDGVSVAWHGDLLALSRDAKISMSLDPGQEISFRMYFSVAKEAPLRTFAVFRNDTRTYEYDLSGVK